MHNQEESFMHFLGDKAGNFYQIQEITSKEESNKAGEKLGDLKKMESAHPLLACAVKSDEKY